MMCTAAVYPSLPPTIARGSSKGFNVPNSSSTCTCTSNSSNYYGGGDDDHEATLSKRKWRQAPDTSLLTRLSPLSERSWNCFVSLDVPFNSSKQPFDIILSLPVEISLSVFSLFSPQDLCNICLVCRGWFNLAQDRRLKEKRLNYVQAQRLTYQQSKENYKNSVFSTPQNHHHQRLSASRSILSPANYPFRNIIHSDPQHFHHPPPPSLSSSSRSHVRTPSSFSLSHMVQRLSLNKTNEKDIRRCLFPEQPSQNNNSNNYSPRRNNRRFSPDLVVGKRSNKSRLRRL